MGVKKEIAKKSGLMIGFYAISKLINFIYFFFVTNILGPFQYGLLSLCMSIYETLSIPIQSINNSLVKFIAEKKQSRYFSVTLKLTIIFSLAFSFFLLIFAEAIAAFFQQPITMLIRLVALFFIFSNLYETFTSVFLGISAIKYYVLNQLVFQTFRLILVMIIIFQINNAYGVFLAFVGSSFFGLLFSFSFIRKINFDKTRVNLKPFYAYNKQFFLLLLLANIQPQIYVFFLANYWTNLEIGYYKFLLGIITLIMVSLISLISPVLLSYFSSLFYKKKKHELEEIFNLSLRVSLYLNLVVGSFILLFLGPIVRAFFKGYTESIHFIPLFVLYGFFMSLNFVVMTLIKATRNLGIFIKFLPISLFFSIAVSFILVPSFNITGVMIATLGSILIMIFLGIFIIKKKLCMKLNLYPTYYDYTLLKKLISLILSKIRSFSFK